MNPFQSSPPLRVLVFASQKGGSGKTTLAGHVAVEAERQGAGPVALIDADPQGSLAKWWNVRQARTPAFIQSQFSSLYQDIESAREQGFRLVVIDTPPAVTRAISEVVAHADLVVVPTRPSPHDLRAVGPTVDIIEGRKKQMIFVLNAATARAKITMEAAIALSQHGTVAPVTVHNRLDFAASMIDGRTVMEIDPVAKSSAEVGDLWRYLAERLARLEPPAQTPGFDQPRFGGMRPVTTFGRAGSAFGRRAFA